MSLPGVVNLVMPPVLASVWFAPHEHFLCVTIGEACNFLGGGFAYLLSALIVTSADEIPLALLIYAIISAVAVIFYIFVR